MRLFARLDTHPSGARTPSSCPTTSIVEVAETDVAADFERVYNSQFDLLNDDDLTELSSGLKPGSSAMVVVWENAWLATLASAVGNSQGQVAVLERILRERVLRAIAALDEN